MKKEKQILMLARVLLEKRGHCKNYFAVDSDGTFISDYLQISNITDRANAFCISGALQASRALLKSTLGYDDPYMEAYSLPFCNAFDMVKTEAGSDNLPNWNDRYDRTKNDVVGLIKKVEDKY